MSKYEHNSWSVETRSHKILLCKHSGDSIRDKDEETLSRFKFFLYLLVSYELLTMLSEMRTEHFH